MNTKLPTINIKGKEYVLVKDRIMAFHENYSNGAIKTELCTAPESKQIVFKAIVIPDTTKPERVFTGYSQAVSGGTGVNATAALENAETSAVGRALAMMGIGVLESVASADEINKSDKAIVTKGGAPYEQYSNAQPKKIVAENALNPCDKCGKEFKVRNGKTGPFYGCTGYPKCKRTISMEDAEMWVRDEYRDEIFKGNSENPPIEAYENGPQF